MAKKPFQPQDDNAAPTNFVNLAGSATSRTGLFIVGAVGGLLGALVDLAKDDVNGAIARFSRMLESQELYFSGARISHQGILFMILLGLFLCWVYQVTSRPDAFIRGLTALAAIGLIAPAADVGNRKTEPLVVERTVEPVSGNPGGVKLDILRGPEHNGYLQTPAFFATPAYAQTAAQQPVGEVTIFLRHLSASAFPAPTRITVWSYADRRLLDLFEVTSARANVIQPVGRYRIDAETEGFSPLRFDITISERFSGVSISADSANVYSKLRRIVSDPVVVEPHAVEASTWKAQGIRLFRAGQYPQAIEAYDEAAALDPTDFEAVSFKGYALFRAGRNNEALTVLENAQREFPDNPWIALNLLKVHCAAGDFATANALTRNEPLISNVALIKADGEIRRICS